MNGSGLGVRVSAIVLAAALAACGTRTVMGEQPDAPTAAPLAGAQASSAAEPGASPTRARRLTDADLAADEAVSEDEEAAPSVPGPEPEPAVADPRDLDAQLSRPDRALSRRLRFARAVEEISQQLGQPISADQALTEMPCGGWSGPECSNLTYGLEAAKLALPLAARLYDDRAAGFAAILVEAVSIHSVWHDAFGFVHRKLGRGAGYTYAGCLMSRCAPGDFTCGQIDGVLYQIGRLVGILDGPSCGPGCTLPDI